MRTVLAAAVLVSCVSCARPPRVAPPVAEGTAVYAVVHPYPDTGHVLVHLRGNVGAPAAAAEYVPLGPWGTDRCDQPELRVVADLPDDGAAITLTLLAGGATCVINATDLVAIGAGSRWERGVMVPAGSCGDAEWALAEEHPAAAVVDTETTQFFGQEEADALPAEEAALLRSASPASMLRLRSDVLPYEIYELWRSNGPDEGVRVWRDGALVRALPSRPRSYVVEGAEVRAILWEVGGFRAVAVE